MSEFDNYDFGETDLDEMVREKQILEEESARTGMNYLQLEEGNTMIRIMPPWEKGRKSPFYKAWVHYVKNPAKPKENGKPFLCPNKMNDKPCIVCAKVSQLRRSANPVDKEIAGELAASRQVFANVVNLNDPDRGVQVMKFGKTIYSELLAYMDPKDPASVGDLSHPEKGYNVVIDRKGKGLETRYKVRIARAPSPLPKAAWLGEMNNLVAVVDEMNDARVKAIMEGEDPDTDFDPKKLEAQQPPADDEFLPPR